VDDSTFPAVLAALHQELDHLAQWVATTPDLDLAAAETMILTRVRDLGARVLEGGLAARTTPVAAVAPVCACGHRLHSEGRRPKGVQTLVGWITVDRAYYRCLVCGAGSCPHDAALGLGRDSHSPGVRRLASRFGALLRFAPAAATLQEAAGIQVSASTVRTITEGVGTACEATIQADITTAWEQGWEPVAGLPPDRCYVAMDGVCILGTDGAGREVKLGRVVPVHQTAQGERHGPSRYAAGLEPADAFGRRLAVVAHTVGAEQATQLAVLGDGAAWIWNLAAEHFPHAVQIVDWYHASERVWDLGRALYGEGTAETAAWVERQLARLAAGEAATLAAEWHTLPCRGEAATVREAQVTYFTNQASRMAYARYRAAGWDIGSGMIESSCKTVIGQREKGSGMRWSEAGAQTVANVRLLLFNTHWDDYWTAA
jgi:hypothetical protein